APRPHADAPYGVSAVSGLPYCPPSAGTRGGYPQSDELSAAEAAAPEQPVCAANPLDLAYQTSRLPTLPYATAGTSSATVHSGPDQGQDGLSFDQAVQQGLVPSLDDSLKQSGLPLCTDGDKPNVYTSPDALLNAEGAASPEAKCMADPRGTRFFHV